MKKPLFITITLLLAAIVMWAFGALVIAIAHQSTAATCRYFILSSTAYLIWLAILAYKEDIIVAHDVSPARSARWHLKLFIVLLLLCVPLAFLSIEFIIYHSSS